MDATWLQALAVLAAIVLPLLIAWALIARSARVADKRTRAKMRA